MTICEPLARVIPGTITRPVSMDDIPRLTELMQRVSTSVIGEPDATETEVRDDLMGLRFDIATDTALVVNERGPGVGLCAGV